MNKEELLEDIHSCIKDDVRAITKNFVPLYLDWIVQRTNKYHEDNNSRVTLEAAFNLFTNSLMNIVLNTSLQYFDKPNLGAAREFLTKQFINELEHSMNMAMTTLREKLLKENNK